MKVINFFIITLYYYFFIIRSHFDESLKYIDRFYTYQNLISSFYDRIMIHDTS